MKHEPITIKGIDLESQWDCDNRTAAEVAKPTSVIRRGDGTLLCDKHYAQEHPGVPEPTFGWELGVCTMCDESWLF